MLNPSPIRPTAMLFALLAEWWMPVASSATAPLVESATPPALYTEFREYRLSLERPNANPSSFFSRSWNEHLIGWLLQDKPPTSEDLRSLRSRYRFGQVVHVVLAYRVVSSDSGSGDLEVTYRSFHAPNAKTLTISYALEEGRWRISRIDYDLTRPGNAKAETIVETFNAVAGEKMDVEGPREPQ